MEGIVRCSANYVPLSPISFLERSALVYRERPSVIYGDVRYTWAETHERCTKLASALSQLGISHGDVVAALLPNVPAMYELHFGVPMAGGVLCTLNLRHDSTMVSNLLKHSGARLIFVDQQYIDIACNAIEILSNNNKSNLPQIIVVLDKQSSEVTNVSSIPVKLEYENLLTRGKLDFEVCRPKDEMEPISLNYTSGTTSKPKGVLFSHRGAYLNTLATVMSNEMGSMPVYLWTVPMFHCNGWCFTWGVASQGGTNICLRNVTAKGIFSNIAEHKVTYMGGAPTILTMIINSSVLDRKPLPGKVVVITGAAPPPSEVLFKMEGLGFFVTHAYGLTETYGPGTFCTWKVEWDAFSPSERAKLKSRQGVQHICLEEVDVKDPVTMKSMPSDGETMGEVMFRGNTVMSGYLNYDRFKDVIISGGENISLIEVESVLFSHPAILDVVAVARPDDYWGETPCAFMKLKDGYNQVTSEEIIGFCRDMLPHYMAPRTIVFGDLPKTSTGKTQKFVL